MSAPAPKVGAKSDFTKAEIAEFKKLVCAEGRVDQATFEGLLERATRLVTLSVEGKVIGTAAIKRPNHSHHKNVFKNSELDDELKSHPYELGWVVVSPEYRGQHYSESLVKLAISGLRSEEMYAASQERDERMHKTLKKLGFAKSGIPYDSKERAGEKVFVFLKK